MLMLLAEAAWTPSIVGTGVIATIILAAKIVPYLKSKSTNGNGNGESRGETRKALSDIENELKRQSAVDEKQWDGITGNRVSIAEIKTAVVNTANDISEMKIDIKSLLNRERSGRKEDE